MSFLALEAGDASAVKSGNRYERVFPVPVGEIAARSRDYEVRVDSNICEDVNLPTSNNIGIP